jgi:hypothetical protein
MTLPRLCGLLVLVVACWGCSDATSPEPPVIPTREEALEIGAVIDNHTQDLLIAFNISELLLFELPLKPQFAAMLSPHTRLAASCPEVDNDADLDGDGIPDNALFTFADSTCTFFIDGIGTFRQSGSIHIVDSGVEAGYRLIFDHYRIRHDIFGGSNYIITDVSGTYDVTATDSSATLVEALTIASEERLGAIVTTGTSTFHWTAHFKAGPMGFLDLSIPLPTGTLSVAGNTGWNSGKSAYSFTTSTIELLAYDAGCNQGPEFLTGRTRATQNGVEGSQINIRYVGCALEPEITRTRPN